MRRPYLAPLVDVARREIRLSPLRLASSVAWSLAIGSGFVLIMAVMP